MDKGEINKVFVNGRVIIDAVFFFEINLNYTRSCIDKLGKYKLSDGI